MSSESPNSSNMPNRPPNAFADVDNGEDKSHAKLTNIPDYEVTEPNSEISLEWQGVITRHQFRNATKPEIINLSEAIVRRTEVLGEGRERFRYSDDLAYASHYMIISERAWVKELDKEEVELNPEEIGELTFELRAEVIRRLYQCSSRLLRPTEGYNHLFDRKGAWIVEQTIGNPLNPQFVIHHKMTRPGGERRLRYRDNASKIETERKGKKSVREVIVDIEEGTNLFRQYFLEIDKGATVGGEKFDASKTMEIDIAGDGKLVAMSHKDIVIAKFNPIWQADASDALVSSYQQDGSD